MTFILDTNLRQYATDRQWELMTAYAEHGTAGRAAEALGVDRSLVTRTTRIVQAKAARAGYAPEYDYTRPVPDGFIAKGVSTYYNKAGVAAGQWVKSQIDHDRQQELIKAAFEGLKDELPRLHPIQIDRRKVETTDVLCAAYPVGDHHLGMLAWDKETGADWDLKIAEASLNKATDYLVGSAPAASTGLVVFLGDFLHYDSFESVTPRSKNQLDSDSRFPKMVRVGIRTMRYTIDAALQKHEKVHVIVEFGNHDLASTVWLMEAMHCIYENEPRVTIDTTPQQFHYFRFGKVLIGTHHGHDVKMMNLPLLMAADRPQDWAATNYRHWWTGHIHHSKTQAAISSQDYSGCTVESFRVLPPNDAWGAGKGYRPIRDMKSIVFHAEHGEVSRNTVNPGMFR